jgi:hypothetical protein
MNPVGRIERKASGNSDVGHGNDPPGESDITKAGCAANVALDAYILTGACAERFAREPRGRRRKGKGSARTRSLK